MSATSRAALATSSAFIASPLIQATPLPGRETETCFGLRLKHRSCQPRRAKALATSRPTPPVAPIINAVLVMCLTSSAANCYSAAKSSSEFPVDLAPGGVVLGGPRKLPGIGQADAGIAHQIKADARFDQQRIARDRHAGDGERQPNVAKRQQRFGRHVAERVPPAAWAA